MATFANSRDQDQLALLLNNLFPHVSLLALDSGVSSWARVREASVVMGLHQDDVIQTKCRLIADTLAYLLSFEPYNGSGNRAWWLRIRGLNHFGQSTGVGHALIVIEQEERYFLIDAYIGCRDLTYREIDFEEFQRNLASLEEYYDPQLWEDVTGCYEQEIPEYCQVTFGLYNYQDDPQSIGERYQELLDHQPNHRYGHKKG